MCVPASNQIYDPGEDITSEFAEFARTNPEESERLRDRFDPSRQGNIDDQSWTLDLAVGGVTGLIRGGVRGILNFRSPAWRLGWGARGTELERLALGPAGRRGLHPDFPVFDRVADGRATSVASIDLTTRAYIQNPHAVSRALFRKLNAVANYSTRTYARRTIAEGIDFTTRELLVVVPRGAMTTGQRQALQAVYQQGIDRGVTVTIRRF